MLFGSVCSGIEAASVAWESLGWKAAWFAEFDKAPSKVLAHRFPDVVNHGDMTTLAEKVLLREILAPDVLVGGTPCQSFSVAGLRGGLEDARGQLTLAYVVLANAIDQIRREDGLPPCIVVWENVPGVFSHKDNPFGCFLAGLAGEDVPLVAPGKKWTNAGVVLGPERAIAWRTLDAQWFGLAQRRRRVFVVASAREGFDPGEILLEFDGVRRDSAPSREARESVAGTLDARTDGTDGACANHVVAVDGRLRRSDLTPTWWDGSDVSQTLDAVLAKGQTMPEKNRFPAVLQPVEPYAFQPRIARNGRGDMGEVVNALNAQSGETGKGDAAPCVAYAIQERAVCENPDAGPDGLGVRDDDASYTLEARQVPQAVAYGFMPMETPWDAQEKRIHDVRRGVAPTLAARSKGGGTVDGWFVEPPKMAVRRLMPVECERLQGFPDNWTLVPDGKRMAADGPRYKQLGNSMPVPVMRWIGQRITKFVTSQQVDDFNDFL